MSHLHIIADAELETINGGWFSFAGNYASLRQTNSALNVPVAVGGSAGVINTQGVLGGIFQLAVA